MTTVGKYTLESLTSGMYSNPIVFYREYVQNSVDSLDEAERYGLIKHEDGYVNVVIDKSKNCIMIEDNGTGVSSEVAYRKLTDVGNSDKTYSQNRGFRGIGRLGGLPFCDKLTFETSYKGENIKTKIVFDCARLNELLIPNQYKEYDLISVIEEVTDVEADEEDVNAHYFKVIMQGVRDVSGVMDEEEVKKYICENAPLPFNTHKFVWSSKVKEEFRKYDYRISEYNIYFSANKRSKQQLFKLNRGRFEVSPKGKATDDVKDIRILDIMSTDSNLVALLWYSESNLKGNIADSSIKGIRFRKGNILVGNNTNLNSIFNEDRFNGYFQGEVHILDENIIPNSRRDDFEKNSSYEYLIGKLREVGKKLSKEVREASNERNNDDNKKIKKAEEEVKEKKKLISNGFNSQKEKEEVIQQLEKQREILEGIKPEDSKLKQDLAEKIKRIENLVDDAKDSNNFKAMTLPSSYSKKEKNIVKEIFEVISEELDKPTADKIIMKILNRLK